MTVSMSIRSIEVYSIAQGRIIQQDLLSALSVKDTISVADEVLAGGAQAARATD